MEQRKNKSNLEEKNLLKPKTDIVFQSLFNKDNLEITKSFAEDLLEEKINSLVINNDKNLLRNNVNDKMGVLDLELDVNNNKKVDVEIQLVKKRDFIKRLVWYFSRLYGRQIKRGENYEKIKKVVLIAIIDFELEETKNLKRMETVWKIKETKNSQKILTEDLEIHIIEMKKAKKEYEKNKNNKKAQWALFLEDPNSKEVKEIMKENKAVKEAVIKVRELTEEEQKERIEFLKLKAILDEKAIRAAGIEDGEKIGIQKGIQKGKNEIKKRIIKNLFANGMKEKEIAKMVEVTIKEVKNVVKTN